VRDAKRTSGRLFGEPERRTKFINDCGGAAEAHALLLAPFVRTDGPRRKQREKEMTEAKINNETCTTVAQLDVLTENYAIPGGTSQADLIALARWVEAEQPDEPSELQEFHLSQIIRLTKKVGDSNEASAKASRKPAAMKFDRVWSSSFGQIDARANLPAAIEEVEKAKEVRSFLFEDGLGWLRQTHLQKWGTSSAKLSKLDGTPGMRKKFIESTSKATLDILEEAHLELGEALGIGTSDRPAPEDHAENIRQLRFELGDYVRVTAGGVDRRNPKSIAAAEKALAPFSRFRAMVTSRRGSSAAAEVETTEEITTTPAVAPVSTVVTSAPAAEPASVATGSNGAEGHSATVTP
jgi:hypothetical protein